MSSTDHSMAEGFNSVTARVTAAVSSSLVAISAFLVLVLLYFSGLIRMVLCSGYSCRDILGTRLAFLKKSG